MTTTLSPSTDHLLSSGEKFLASCAGEQRYALGSGAMTLGSGPKCDVRLQAAGVKPLHCVITSDDAGVTVRRWAAGASVNGKPFTETKLQEGDCLKVGDAEFILAFDQPQASVEGFSSEPEQAEEPAVAAEQAEDQAGDSATRAAASEPIALLEEASSEQEESADSESPDWGIASEEPAEEGAWQVEPQPAEEPTPDFASQSEESSVDSLQAEKPGLPAEEPSCESEWSLPATPAVPMNPVPQHLLTPWNPTEDPSVPAAQDEPEARSSWGIEPANDDAADSFAASFQEEEVLAAVEPAEESQACEEADSEVAEWAVEPEVIAEEHKQPERDWRAALSIMRGRTRRLVGALREQRTADAQASEAFARLTAERDELAEQLQSAEAKLLEEAAAAIEDTELADAKAELEKLRTEYAALELGFKQAEEQLSEALDALEAATASASPFHSPEATPSSSTADDQQPTSLDPTPSTWEAPLESANDSEASNPPESNLWEAPAAPEVEPQPENVEAESDAAWTMPAETGGDLWSMPAEPETESPEPVDTGAAAEPTQDADQWLSSFMSDAASDDPADQQPAAEVPAGTPASPSLPEEAAAPAVNENSVADQEPLPAVMPEPPELDDDSGDPILDWPSEQNQAAPSNESASFAAPTSFYEQYAHLLPSDDQPAAAADQPPEPAAATPIVEPVDQPAAADDDVDIDAYMQQLLQRMRGDDEPVAAAPAFEVEPEPVPASPQAAAVPVAAPQPTPAPAPAEPLMSLEELKRSEMPERSTDMNSLRELANQSARQAIGVAASKQYKEKSVVNLIIAGIASVCGGYLMVSAPGAVSTQSICGALALLWACIWGSVSVKNLYESLRAGTRTSKPVAKPTPAAELPIAK